MWKLRKFVQKRRQETLHSGRAAEPQPVMMKGLPGEVARCPAAGGPLVARGETEPAEVPCRFPRQRIPLSALATSLAALSSYADSCPSPLSAASSCTKSSPATYTDDNQQMHRLLRAKTKSPVVEAVLTQPFDALPFEDRAAFDWSRCVFLKQEEEAMWIPSMSTDTDTHVHGRRRSASAPIPCELFGAEHAQVLPASHAANCIQEDDFYSFVERPEHHAFWPATSLASTERISLSTGSSGARYSSAASPCSTQPWLMDQQDLDDMEHIACPESGMTAAAASDVVPPSPSACSHCGQPSPSHTGSFQVLSRQPSPLLYGPMSEPTTPVSAYWPRLDYQRSTNELRQAGARAIRDRAMQREKQSSPDSSMQAVAPRSHKHRPTSSSDTSPQKCDNRSRYFNAEPWMLEGRLEWKGKRRSRPSTAETVQALVSTTPSASALHTPYTEFLRSGAYEAIEPRECRSLRSATRAAEDRRRLGLRARSPTHA